ncbi:hypothetical protein, partial [Pseudomonas sp. A-RE-19]|uniref:hypothetical protein n=1 Tax=Pseudomonas sp. A-RE-19 TaxID=2832401 RepID=UPI001CBC6A8A
PQNDGVNGLKSLFSSASRTKANAPNKSGRLLDPLILRFHTVCFGSSYGGQCVQPGFSRTLSRNVATTRRVQSVIDKGVTAWDPSG